MFLFFLPLQSPPVQTSTSLPRPLQRVDPCPHSLRLTRRQSRPQEDHGDQGDQSAQGWENVTRRNERTGALEGSRRWRRATTSASSSRRNPAPRPEKSVLPIHLTSLEKRRKKDIPKGGKKVFRLRFPLTPFVAKPKAKKMRKARERDRDREEEEPLFSHTLPGRACAAFQMRHLSRNEGAKGGGGGILLLHFTTFSLVCYTPRASRLTLPPPPHPFDAIIRSRDASKRAKVP